MFPLVTAAREQPRAAWAEHQLMGHCFVNSQDFIKAAFGSEAVKDENIKSRPARPLVDGSTWIVDQTPGTNYPWYLLQPGDEGKLCLTLFVPAAAEVTLNKSGKDLAAKAKTQAPPGLPARQVEFKRRPADKGFSPTLCLEIKFAKNKGSTSRKVDCTSLFDDFG